MLKLCDLTNKTQLCYERNYELLPTSKEEIQSDPQFYKGHKVFISIDHPATFDMQDLYDFLDTAQENQEQYEDWSTAMYMDIEDSEEAKAFLNLLNRLAQKHMSFAAGEEVDISCAGDGGKDYG